MKKKTLIKTCLATAIASSLVPLSATAALFPNGDFSDGGTSWEEVFVGGTYVFSYPTTGGNPDNYGIIDHSAADGGFGIWIAGDGNIMSLDSLGLVAGTTYTFSQDMILISGSNLGTFKVESYDDTGEVGNSGEVDLEIDGDVSSWQTYTFDVLIPSNATGIKFVPVAGADSVVGYDNLGFTIPPIEVFAADIQLGKVLSWFSEGSDKFHQPQSSEDGIEWDNIGAPILGGTQTSIQLDGPLLPFYRVEVMEILGNLITLNDSFETEGIADPNCAESWSCFGSQPPTRITTDARTGDASMRMAVQNDDGGAPNNSEIQQNISAAGGSITPGESYDFSFWAKQVSFEVSYVQNFRVQWLDAGGAILPGGTEFAPFTGGTGEWTEIKVADLVAPAAAETAFIQIFGATGAVPGEDAKGEVLIDDVQPGTITIQDFDEIDATVEDGLQVSWDTDAGQGYQVQASDIDVVSFEDFGGPITGDGQTASVGDTITTDAKFYRVLKTVSP